MDPWYGRRRAVLFFGVVKVMSHIPMTCSGLQSNLDMKFTDIFVLSGQWIAYARFLRGLFLQYYEVQ